MQVRRPNALTADQKWMLNYLNQYLDIWQDVSAEASRTLKKVRTQKDFADWVDYFLPKKRVVQTKQALSAYKINKARYTRKPKQATKVVSVPLDAKVVRLLQKRARESKCSISELLIKKLA